MLSPLKFTYMPPVAVNSMSDNMSSNAGDKEFVLNSGASGRMENLYHGSALGVVSWS